MITLSLHYKNSNSCVPKWLKLILCINESNEHIVANELKILKNLKKTIQLDEELFLSRFKKIIKFNIDSKKEEMISLEWKQVAGRINKVIFVVLIIVIESTPRLLFAKYYISDDITLNSCGCENYN